MAQKTISTQVIIQANPTIIWQVLTDFEAYPEWNPFITSIEGKVEVGQKLKADIGNMTFKPTVLTATPNKEFKWIGRLLFKGIFDGEHRFQIIDNGDGTSTFIQSENFSGILVGPFSKKLDNETKPGFELMNQKLKERAEELSK